MTPMLSSGRHIMQARIPLILPSLLLLMSCESIGDLSEGVGGLVSPLLEDAGGGLPVLADDGGKPISLYLEHVGGEAYSQCKTWRTERAKAAIHNDPTKLKELDDAVEGLTAELNEVMASHLEQLELSMPLSIPEAVGPRLGGSTLDLSSCAYEACSLRCESVVEVASVEEKDKQGNVIEPSWSKPSQLLWRHDTNYAAMVQCAATDDSSSGGERVYLSENRWKWLYDLAVTSGAELDELDLWMGPSLEIIHTDDEESTASVKPGDQVTVRLNGLDQCLEKNGRVVIARESHRPTIQGLSLKCGVAQEWDPLLPQSQRDGVKIEGNRKITKRPPQSVDLGLSSSPMMADKMELQLRLRSPQGLRGLGYTDLRDAQVSASSMLRMQLMATKPGQEDGPDVLLGTHSVGLSCQPTFHASKQIGGDLKDDEKWDWPSLREMTRALEYQYDFTDEQLDQIAGDDKATRAAYQRQMLKDEDQAIICRAYFPGNKLLGEETCGGEDLTDLLSISYTAVVTDLEENWSSTMPATATRQTVYTDNSVTAACIEATAVAREKKWRSKRQWTQVDQCYAPVSDARAKTRAACEDPEQASLDTLQAVADCVDSSETDKAASACFTEKVEAIHKACTDD